MQDADAHLSSSYKAQQGGLAHAIGAGQTVAPPCSDCELRALQQDLALGPDGSSFAPAWQQHMPRSDRHAHTCVQEASSRPESNCA